MRTITALPAELTRLLFDLGSRKLVLVEGPDDREVFHQWYGERWSDVEFYVAGGSESVESFLQTVLAHSTTRRAYGIIDRDFRSDAEVDAPLNDPSAHLFILRRYALENYLLEPEAVWEELRVYHGTAFAVPDARAMEASLLQLCQRLRTVVAANWVFYEVGGVEYFGEGHDLSDRTELIRQAARRLGCDEAEAERRIAEKEALLDPMLTALDTAHLRINGKHLLQQVYEVHVIKVKKGLLKDHLRNLLARSVKRLGLHADVTTIVEGRILGSE
jgi:hypothetical protein